MKAVESSIIDRFPDYRERILQRCIQDTAVAELCRDYDALMEALQADEPRQSLANDASGTRQELRELVNALEHLPPEVEIPESLFFVVAEILAFCWRIKNEK